MAFLGIFILFGFELRLPEASDAGIVFKRRKTNLREKKRKKEKRGRKTLNGGEQAGSTVRTTLLGRTNAILADFYTMG